LKLIGIPAAFFAGSTVDGARYDIISIWENALRSSHSARYALGAGVDLLVRSWHQTQIGRQAHHPYDRLHGVYSLLALDTYLLLDRPAECATIN
jgi:hypothetical protein